jgi:tetratricopeptide (TPR) repeat protein
VTEPLPQLTADLAAIGRAAEADFVAGRLLDAVRLLTLATARTRGAAIPVRAHAALLVQLGRCALYHASFVTNDYDPALRALEQAEAAARAAGDVPLLGTVLDTFGLAHYHRALTTSASGFDQAADYFEQALPLRSAGEPCGHAETLFHQGLIHERAGRFAAAQGAFEQAHALASAHACQRVLGETFRHLGFAYARAGQPDRALAHFESSLAALEAAGFALALPFAQQSIGDMLAEQQR